MARDGSPVAGHQVARVRSGKGQGDVESGEAEKWCV
jgi:hypothetical protein